MQATIVYCPLCCGLLLTQTKHRNNAKLSRPANASLKLTTGRCNISKFCLSGLKIPVTLQVVPSVELKPSPSILFVVVYVCVLLLLILLLLLLLVFTILFKLTGTKKQFFPTFSDASMADTV